MEVCIKYTDCQILQKTIWETETYVYPAKFLEKGLHCS